SQGRRPTLAQKKAARAGQVGGPHTMEQRIDVFSHILPKRYEEERWKRAEKTHFVDHSPSHLKYVRGGKLPIATYQVFIALDTRFRMMEEFGGYRQEKSVDLGGRRII